MAEAMALGQSVRTSTSPNPWVGAVVVPAGDRPGGRGRHRASGRPPRRGGRARAGRARPPGVRRVYVTLEPCCPPRAGRPLRRGAHRRQAWPGWSSGCSTPTRRCRRPGDRPAPPRPGSRSRSAPRRRRRALAGPVPDAPPDAAGPGSCSSWPPPSTGASPPPTVRASWITGPEARARRPPAAGRERRHPGRRGHGAGRRPGSHGPHDRRAVTRSGWSWAAPGGGPGAACARRTMGTSSRSSTTSGAAACSSSWWRAGRGWRGRFTGGASSTSTCCTWPRPCWAATTGSRCSAARGRHHGRRVARPDRRVRAARSRPADRSCWLLSGGGAVP